MEYGTCLSKCTDIKSGKQLARKLASAFDCYSTTSVRTFLCLPFFSTVLKIGCEEWDGMGETKWNGERNVNMSFKQSWGMKDQTLYYSFYLLHPTLLDFELIYKYSAPHIHYPNEPICIQAKVKNYFFVANSLIWFTQSVSFLSDLNYLHSLNSWKI